MKIDVVCKQKRKKEFIIKCIDNFKGIIICVFGKCYFYFILICNKSKSYCVKLNGKEVKKKFIFVYCMYCSFIFDLNKNFCFIFINVVFFINFCNYQCIVSLSFKL